MMLEGPLSNPDETFYIYFEYINTGISALFLMELLIKVIAMGFILHDYSYMRDGWNVLDFFIVIISITSLIMDQ
jgi:hypothetical protein